MARRQKLPVTEPAPETLNDSLFFGLKLDEEQKHFRDVIWDMNNEIVFVDAAAGTGKTTIAVATSVLLHHYHKVDDIVYVMHPVGDAQGYLPGTISEKSSVWLEALYQALITSNEDPDHVIKSSSMADQKSGSAYVTAITDSYLRGSNIGGENGCVLIIDEAQNYDEFSLRKVLTRACANTRVIVIGHRLQCDLKDISKSGFLKCMDHFKSKNDPHFAFCELHTNHRSRVAQVADEPWVE